MRISDWSSDVCSSDLGEEDRHPHGVQPVHDGRRTSAGRRSRARYAPPHATPRAPELTSTQSHPWSSKPTPPCELPYLSGTGDPLALAFFFVRDFQGIYQRSEDRLLVKDCVYTFSNEW